MSAARIPAPSETEYIVLSSQDHRTPTTPRRSSGRRVRALGLTALIGGMLTAGYVGATIVPVQLEAGRLLTDAPPGYQATVHVTAALLAVWVVVALAAIGAALAALRRHEPRTGAVTALSAVILAPVLWVAAVTVPALVMLPALT